MELKHFLPAADVAADYQQYIRRIPLLTPSEEKSLARGVQLGDKGCRDALVVRNLRLVMNMARHYDHRGMPLMDLVSEGNTGLIRAVEKFDPTKGCRFSTYATWWVRQSIERGIHNQSRLVRLPVHVVKDIGYCMGRKHELEKKLMRPVRQTELSDHCDKEARKLDKLMTWQDSNSATGRFAEDAEVVVDEAADPADIHSEQCFRERIKDWLGDLSQKQRDVIIRRFGFYQHECRTLEEIGRHIGLTRERVRQIQLEALAILREKARTQGVDMSGF